MTLIVRNNVLYSNLCCHQFRILRSVTIRCQAIVGSMYSIRAAMFHVKHTDDKKPTLWAGLLGIDLGLCERLHIVAMQQILDAIVYKCRIVTIVGTE